MDFVWHKTVFSCGDNKESCIARKLEEESCSLSEQQNRTQCKNPWTLNGPWEKFENAIFCVNGNVVYHLGVRTPTQKKNLRFIKIAKLLEKSSNVSRSSRIILCGVYATLWGKPGAVALTVINYFNKRIKRNVGKRGHPQVISKCRDLVYDVRVVDFGLFLDSLQ